MTVDENIAKLREILFSIKETDAEYIEIVKRKEMCTKFQEKFPLETLEDRLTLGSYYYYLGDGPTDNFSNAVQKCADPLVGGNLRITPDYLGATCKDNKVCLAKKLDEYVLNQPEKSKEAVFKERFDKRSCFS